MDRIEFHCRNCDSLLRVKPQDQDKLIRCPKCSDLQRYAGGDDFRPLEVAPGQPHSHMVPNHQDQWSLKTADGQEYHQLDRNTFEQLLQQGHANSAAYFIGGEYRQWTPVQRLFQSATGPQRPVTEYPQQGAQTFYQPAGGNPATALPRQQQLPDGYGTYVLVLGVVSIFTFCLPIFSIGGLILGVVDLVRLNNGDISNRYKTRLVIGFLMCLFSLAIGTCFGCNIRFG